MKSPADRVLDVCAWVALSVAALVHIALGLLALVYPRRPGVRVASTPPPDTTECRSAVHEAGHAVANWSSSVTLTVHHARIHESGGDVESSRYPITTDGARWNLVVTALAGIAAEGIVYGSFRSGQARCDLEAALQLAREIRTPQSWDDDWDPNVRGPDFKKMFAPEISLAVAIRLGVAYRMARRIVHAYDHRFYRLVSMLLAQRTAHTADLGEVLGHRILVVIAGIRGASFILPRRAA